MKTNKFNIRRRGNRNRRQRGVVSRLEQMALGEDVQKFRRDTSLICKIPAIVCPKSVMVRLSFPDSTTTRIGTASPSENWSIRTSAYDPDPSFLTGAVPGFTEWASMYQSYKVHGIGVRGSVTNGDVIAQEVIFHPYSGSQITNNSLSSVQLFDRGANPLARSVMLAGTSGGLSSQKVSMFWNLTTILGSTQWLTDDGYSSFTNSNPAAVIYVLGASYSASGANLVAGLYTMLYYDMDVEFFGRKDFQT